MKPLLVVRHSDWISHKVETRYAETLDRARAIARVWLDDLAFLRSGRIHYLSLSLGIGGKVFSTSRPFPLLDTVEILDHE